MTYVIPLTDRASSLSAATNWHGNFARGWRGSGAIDQQNGESTMTRFKLLSVAALLSTVIAMPAIAQQAVQEPGEQAFYQSLGVGSGSGGTANVLASVRSVGLSVSAPAKPHVRETSKHYSNAYKQ
jgi:hypothetical protein